MKKNEFVTVEIEDIANDGEGIGKVDGYPLFIKDTVIGDVVEAKVVKVGKSYGYARLSRVLTPSPDRVPARCPLARRCGGCQIQEMSYERQLKFKEDQVENCLMRIGAVPEDIVKRTQEPMVGMEDPFRYRNKAQLPIGTDKEGKSVAGFYAGRTHEIIPVKDCRLEVEVDETIQSMVLSFMDTYKIPAYDERTKKGLLRHLLIRYGFSTGEIMVTLVVNGDHLPHQQALIKSLTQIPGMTGITLNINRAHTNVILGEEIRILWGQGYITDQIGEVCYQISPLSFYQVNPIQTKRMYDAVRGYAALTGQETVWDLYCGIGTIALYLAGEAKEVCGVEVVPDAVRDAKENAKRNGITNARFYEGKAEEVLPVHQKESGTSSEVMIVDPPRKGCAESLLETMAERAPERIIYVSCNPSTLARDVKYLRARGYEIKAYRPFDCFPQTVHTETVLLLSRSEAT